MNHTILGTGSMRSRRFRHCIGAKKDRGTTWNGSFGFGRANMGREPEIPRSFTRSIFRVVFHFRSSFFVPRPQRKRLLHRLARALMKHGLDQWTVGLLSTLCLYL